MDDIDILIVTAIEEECDAVLLVDEGAAEGSKWEQIETDSKLECFVREFAGHGGPLRMLVTRALGMGGQQAIIAASPLLARFPQIRCLAMCGVCAGRRGDVSLGDVIVADRTWPYDAGKVKVGGDGSSASHKHQGDMELYRIRPMQWKQRAQRFVVDQRAAWLLQRPLSYEAQAEWLLLSLEAGSDPRTAPDRKNMCPDYAETVQQLWKVGWLRPDELELTDQGRKRAQRLLLLYPDGLPKQAPFRVVVGPIASGAPVVQNPQIFDELSNLQAMRKVIGLEMETAAILNLAEIAGVEASIVMKGVMDHADEFKSDNMKRFAARASAECLLAFLREFMPPKSGAPVVATENHQAPAGTASLDSALLRLLRAVPSHRESPLTASQIAKRARGVIGVEEDLRGATSAVLQVLDLMGALDWTADACRLQNQVAHYLRESLAWYEGSGIPILENWTRYGTAGSLHSTRLFDSAPYFLKCLEERRVQLAQRFNVSAGASRTQDVSVVLLKGHGPGGSYFLHCFDPKANQYQLIGGRRRPDESSLHAARREFLEEAGFADLDFNDQPQFLEVRPETITYTEVSRTYGALTEYRVSFYQAKVSRIGTLSEGAEWISLTQMQAGVGPRKRHISQMFRRLDSLDPDLLENLPVAIPQVLVRGSKSRGGRGPR